MTAWLRLRHRLIPYLYTAMERTHAAGEALVRPMYYGWPEEQEAYRFPNQFLFGPSLMICPITEPVDSGLGLASVTAWLPEGRWFDFFTGQPYTGDRIMRLWRSLDGYPALAPAGAIVPLSNEPKADQNPAVLTLRVFAGADNEYTLYEDDGLTFAYEDGACARIPIRWDDAARTLTVGAREGAFPGMLQQRRFVVMVVDPAHPHAYDPDAEGPVLVYDGKTINQQFI